jgi:hypothetical protein
MNYSLILNSHLHSKQFLVRAETEHTDFSSVNVGIPNDRVIVPLLYLLYDATTPESTTVTFADVIKVRCGKLTSFFELSGLKEKGS